MHWGIPLLALAAAAAPVLAQAQLAADSFPPRRPGQWELKMVTEKPAGGPAVNAQMCLDAATDRELMDFGLRMSKDSCKRYEMKRAGKTWVIESECTFGPLSSTSRTTISGDFQSSVTVRIEGTTEGMPGAGKGPQATLMTQNAKFVSPTCTAGMTPGDIDMGAGIKFNVKQIKSLQKLLGNIQIR